MSLIDTEVGSALTTINSWVDGFFKLLPNMFVAVILLTIFILLAYFIAKVIRKRAYRRNRISLGNVLSSIVKWTIIFFGIMLAVMLVIPSITPGDIIAGLGVGSIAIGFAFKDILQNVLAGILILIRQPFSIGDQIVSGAHEGTVEKIETRATFIITYDGQRVVIPNSDIYTNAIIVKTAFKQTCSEYDIGIGCNDDWEKAKTLILEAAKSCEGVSYDPSPEVIPIAIANFSNKIRLRWWTDSQRTSVMHTYGCVIESVYKKLTENGIDLPYPTQVILFHDQTEATDGIRDQQREGWPAGKGKIPKANRIAQAITDRSNSIPKS